VEKVYPSSDEVPANLLKFYICFSRPMRESHEIFDCFDLRKENGELVDDPWRRTELWSDDCKRLTLWIHPGRVKEGVNLREQIGPVLEPGKTYTLVIATRLLDASGLPLRKTFSKTFRVTAPVRTRPSPAEWTVFAPAAGTTHPLRVTFPRPLDHALLGRLLKVVDRQGRPVAGSAEVGTEERSWIFVPIQPWTPSDYTLRVDEHLEDLAGNTPARVFELDLTEPPAAKLPLRRVFRPLPR
jgi:hypothetical protein